VVVRNRLLLTAAIVLGTIAAATGVTTAAPAAAAPGPCGTATTPRTYRHVIWIWMENHSLRDIIGNKSQAPYINSIATSCGLATDFHVTTHPSLPNYLAATSGLAQGSLPATTYLDCSPSVICHMTVGSIFGQGESWKAYEESMPSNCHKSDSGEYKVSHTSCIVPTIVISPSTPVGATSKSFFDHYSLLATTEQLLGLRKLASASSAPTMTAAFHL
jgi:hypothetical protein